MISDQEAQKEASHWRRWRWVYRASAVLILLLIVALGWSVTHQQGRIFDRAHSSQHFRLLNEPSPPQATRSTAPAALSLSSGPPADTGSVLWQYLNGPGDQGDVGSCQCWAFRTQYDYLWNWRHRLVKKKRSFSCLFWYTEVGLGQDPGSLGPQYTSLIGNKGGVPHSLYDWTGRPKVPGLYPQPPNIYQAALKYRFLAYYAPVTYTYGATVSAIWFTEWNLYHHNSVNIDFPVYDGRDGLFGDTYHVDLPGPRDVNEGGHAVTFVKYLRTLCIVVSSGEKVCGWFLAQNSWGKDYGINRDSLQHQADGNNGYFLMSYRFVEGYSYGLAALHLGQGLPNAPRVAPPPVWHQPDPSVTASRLIPPPATSGRIKATRGSWVRHVYAKDLAGHVDLARALDQAAQHYHVNAVGLTAVIGGECGFFTHSTICDRLGGGYDYSFGACQVTVATASGYGVGNGLWDGYTGPNATRVRTYENNATQCIWLMAKIFASFKHYLWTRPYDRCPVDFPALDVAWNAGPGNACAFILNPPISTVAGHNYWVNFMGWYRAAQAYAVPKDPYPLRKR